MIQIGKPLPKADIDTLKYYRGSVNPDHNYCELKDAHGAPVIVKQECESWDEYEIRKKLTNPRNYIQSIVNKYFATVFRNDPEVDERFQEFYNNNLGTIKDSLYESEVVGRSFILVENDLNGSELSVAQMQNANYEELFVFLPAETIREIQIVDGYVVYAVVTFQDSLGTVFARQYNPDGTAQDVTINQQTEIVQTISEPYSTGYNSLPIVGILPKIKLCPMLADSQKQIANYLSLLNQELFNHTFSQKLLSGLDLSNKTEEEKMAMKMEMARSKFICTGESVSVSPLGSDIQQSDSIRKSIEDEETNLFTLAGIREPNGVVPESGMALLIQEDSYFINATALVDALETALNNAIGLISDRLGVDYNPIYFSRSFTTPDYDALTISLRNILSLSVPEEYKQKAIQIWAQQYFGQS
jgi:hypothetical protein